MKEFNKKLQEQFDKMCSMGKLFRVALTGSELWTLYLNSFDTNPIFRDPASSVHNCNTCNNFIRRYGNVVAITLENQIISIFNISLSEDDEMFPVANEMAKAISNSKIVDVFFETFNELNSLPYEKGIKKSADKFQLGIAKNFKQYNEEEAAKFGVVSAGEIKEFNHIHLQLPTLFVDKSDKSIESIIAEYRDAKNVFKRTMDEISIDTLYLVRDLINQGSLLDGTTHLYKIEAMIPLREEYKSYSSHSDIMWDNWCWVKSYKFNLAKFKNELIGVLCSELSEGKELNDAVQSWNKRVDPANYMKAVAPITKKQIEEAKKFVEENGYEESFNRRLATIDDIKVSEILHSNVGKGEIKSVSIFDQVKSTSTRHKRSEFDKVEEVSIDKFMSDILPTCTAIEAFLTNQQEGNLVSLTTANNPDSKPIFKWSNNYSWTFNGNLAGKSQIKDAVKSRGGNVEGIMRVSLAFPNTSDDYDLHMIEPHGNRISYGCLRLKQPSSGILDLDAQGRDGYQVAEKRVENIIYTDKAAMPKGTYNVWVDNYYKRGLHTTFTIEIEVEGESTTLEFIPNAKENRVQVVAITFNGKDFEVTPSSCMKIIDSKSISKEVYGLETNQFHKVNLICLSPNHWAGNNVGNKHYFFMLDGCKPTTSLRGFHNENLIPELAQHRKVLEVLGTTNMITPNGHKQLSGLGFNATVRDELVVKLSGTHKRVVKIKF